MFILELRMPIDRPMDTTKLAISTYHSLISIITKNITLVVKRVFLLLNRQNIIG